MISERLRFHGRYASESLDECTARKNTERETAADLIDALVAVVEPLVDDLACGGRPDKYHTAGRAALAMARRK